MRPEQLTDAIERKRAALGMAVFLLVDPMTGLAPTLAPSVLSRRPQARIDLPGRDDIPVEARPFVVPLHEGYDELLYAAARMAAEPAALTPDAPATHRVCPALGGWLFSQAPLTTLARHLSRCMHQRDPQRRRRFVRWSDPRVLYSMWPELDAGQRAALLGPVNQWWTVAWQAELLCCSLDTASAGEAGPEALLITQPQWLRIERMAAVHTCLQRSLEGVAGDNTFSILQRIDQLVRQAEARGFSEREDLVAYAGARLRLVDDGALSAFEQAGALALDQRRPLENCLAEAGLID